MPLILLLPALGLAACGDDPPASGLDGELRLVRSGGIAGPHDELVVRPDGRATLRGEDGRRVFELSGEELGALTAAMRAGDEVSDPAVPDARVHTITYGGATARTDDARLERSANRPPVLQLGKIVQAHR